MTLEAGLRIQTIEAKERIALAVLELDLAPPGTIDALAVVVLGGEAIREDVLAGVEETVEGYGARVDVILIDANLGDEIRGICKGLLRPRFDRRADAPRSYDRRGGHGQSDCHSCLHLWTSFLVGLHVELARLGVERVPIYGAWGSPGSPANGGATKLFLRSAQFMCARMARAYQPVECPGRRSTG